MRTFYTSAYPLGHRWSLRSRVGNMGTKALLWAHGIRVPEGFFSDGLPQLHFSDMRGYPIHPADFADRIILHPNITFSSGGVSPFHSGTVRLTVVRWGSKPDECGRIETKSNLNGTAIVSYRSVYIGKSVSMGPSVTIMDCDGHSTNRLMPDGISHFRHKPVVIEDGCWIGFGATILKGVRVGHRAVIGAGSVVTRDVPPSCLVVGSPARVVKHLENDNASSPDNELLPIGETGEIKMVNP